MRSDWNTTSSATATWTGQLSDGVTASSRAVSIALGVDGLHLSADGWSAIWRYETLSTGSPLMSGAVDVLIHTKASGATLFIKDRGFTRQLVERAPQTSIGAARKAGLKVAGPVGAAALALTGVVIWFDLSPSKGLARLMPDSARQQLGRSVLAGLPVTQTCSAQDGRAALDVLVRRLRPETHALPLQVSVLDWSVVNAFAVPGGRVVLTRAIIERAANADEIAGVLAHEMGHAIELHPEAGLVRSVGFWALIQMVFTGTPGALGNVGNLLAQLAYTRSYEREADAIALRLLKEAGISHRPFAGFFRRLESGRRAGTEPQRRGRLFPNDVLETHPPTPERIATIERQPDYPATPALTDVQWQALRRICAGSQGPGGRIDTRTSDIEAPQLDPDAALKSADAAVAARPGDAAAFAARAFIHLEARRHDAAVADFTQAMTLQPGTSSHVYGRGRAHQNAERFALAIADYTEAIRLNPRHSLAFAARGATHRLANNSDAASADFDQSLSLNPRNEYALYQRGLLSAALKRWLDSERDFSKVIDGNRGYAFAYVRRGEAREALRRRDEAIADYRAALNAAPSSPDASLAFRAARDRLKALGVAE